MFAIGTITVGLTGENLTRSEVDALIARLVAFKNQNPKITEIVIRHEEATKL